MYPYDTQMAYPQIQEQLMKSIMPQQNQQATHVVKVNGKAGAESYQLPPNSDILLLDMNDPIVWFVQSDGAGYKTVTPYDISQHKEVSQTDIIKSMEDRITKLEEAINNGSWKSNSSTNNAKPKPGQQHNDAGSGSNAPR